MNKNYFPGIVNNSHLAIKMAEVAQNLFAVVKFLKDSSHDFVPVNWLTQSGENYFVKFPKLKTSKVVALQTNAKSKPEAVWPEWEVRVVRFYGKYQSFPVKPVVALLSR